MIGTGNTGKLYALGAQESHEYASDVLDAGAMARFGRIEVEPGSSGYEILTRTGNIEQPVRGWSDWEALKDGAVASPPGRFMQWKAVLHAGGVVGSVGVNYLPVNSAPVVDELVVVPGARVNAQGQANPQPQTVNINFPSASQSSVAVSFDTPNTSSLTATKDRTAITARWAAHDDDGDDLTYSLYLRGDGEHVWRLLKDGVTEKAYSFDATLIPDGGYALKVVASDAPSHTPGSALTGVEGERSVRGGYDAPLDHQHEGGAGARPLRDGTLRSAGRGELRCGRRHVADRACGVFGGCGAVAVHRPGGRAVGFEARTLPGSDRASTFKQKTGEHVLTVRAYDRHDNIGLAKTVFETTAAPGAK